MRNIADIDIAPKKVAAIVNRVLRDNLGSIDAKTRELLSTELQIALDRVSREDPEAIVNEMIDAVRSAISDANVTDERAEANYKDLLSAFKGRKFYLTDEQLSQLAEHDITLKDFRNKMFGYGITIVSRENAKRSIDGGYADASELSLEGLYDMLESPEKFLPFKREEWDEYGYDAPYILMETFNNLRDMRAQPLSEAYSEEYVDDMAVALTAKITGAVVEEKYNSKKNPYVSKLVDDLKAKRKQAVQKQKEKNRQKLDELKQKERARAEKREKELREHFKEQRAKNTQKRKATELKYSINRKVRQIDKLLNRSDKNKTVKQGLRESSSKLLEIADMLFPQSLSLEQMARDGVSDATPAEQKLLDQYARLLDTRKKGKTEEGREAVNKALATLRKRITAEKGVKVEVERDGKTVKEKMSVPARERLRYENAVRANNSLKLKDALTELADAYRAVENAKETYLQEAFDPNIINAIEDLRQEVGSTLAKDMSYTQLEKLNKVVTMALTNIRDANKAFKLSKSYTEASEAIMKEIRVIRMPKEVRNKVMTAIANIGWGSLKPVYAMRLIGSSTFTEAYWNLQNSENTWYVDISEAKEFKDALEKKYGYRNFDFKICYC